jgi:hypothetical protein
MTRKRWAAMIPMGVVLIALGTIPVGGGAMPENEARRSVAVTDLSDFDATRPDSTLRLLFIHHSCGGIWLAPPGPARGENCILESHPEGGGLRHALQDAGYEVHEASYGSEIGQETDIFDWPAKFRQKMDKVLRCDRQDRFHAGPERNRIVVFKSCYPNNLFRAGDASPGGAAPSESGRTRLTLANAKAAYEALLPEFARHPEVLFVAVTAPPLAPRPEKVPLWKWIAYRVLGRPDPGQRLEASGPIARAFSEWLEAEDGWLAAYPGRNVAVFNLYDCLTDEGASNYSRYPTGDGFDSHPNRAGNVKATRAFVPFLNRAVRRAGLAD